MIRSARFARLLECSQVGRIAGRGTVAAATEAMSARVSIAAM